MDELILERNHTDALLAGKDLPQVVMPKHMDVPTAERNLISVTFVGRSFQTRAALTGTRKYTTELKALNVKFVTKNSTKSPT